MGTNKKSQAMEKKSTMMCLLLGLLLCVDLAECKNKTKQPPSSSPGKGSKLYHYAARQCRGRTANLQTDFGGIGDGTTSNTAAFKAAVANLTNVKGGALLFVPPGRWLTGSFSLTSHFTLFIHKDAVILASQEESDYPLVKALPSYGVGRDRGDLRFASLITGTNLTDVVITGGNGTIDGQGKVWWDKFKNNQLKNTRPYLIEIMFSNQVQISDLTLLNSSSWHVHPIYCKEVIIEHLTIIAPVDVPNTDGINPDSCTNTRIRDSYIVSGDDCIAVKSGWDQYGIQVNMPTKNLSIERLTCISPDSAVIALGSEMSGGIQNVRARDIVALESQSIVRIKTAIGRGGYVKDIYVQNITADVIKYVFWTAGDYKSHPDSKYNKTAFPIINNVNFRNVVATNVTYVGSLAGIEGDPFTGICVSNVKVVLAEKKKKKKKQSNMSEFEEEKKTSTKLLPWICSDINGTWNDVTPTPCGLLKEEAGMSCAFPKDKLDIDAVVLKTCSV